MRFFKKHFEKAYVNKFMEEIVWVKIGGKRARRAFRI